MHYSINPDDTKAETENLGHKVANIWNIKQHRTQLPLSMFFVHFKPALTNKDIFDVEFLQQCKIKLKLQGINESLPNALIVNAMGTQKNYCHL
jgi:hypothetical protein